MNKGWFFYRKQTTHQLVSQISDHLWLKLPSSVFLLEWSALSPQWLMIGQHLSKCGIFSKDKQTWESVRGGHKQWVFKSWIHKFVRTPAILPSLWTSVPCIVRVTGNDLRGAFLPFNCKIVRGTWGVGLIKQNELTLSYFSFLYLNSSMSLPITDSTHMGFKQAASTAVKKYHKGSFYASVSPSKLLNNVIYSERNEALLRIRSV